MRLESPPPDEERDLARVAFARLVDVVRALLGDIEALTATGDPPGEHPDLELVVQLRARIGRRAELRVRAGDPEPAQLTLQGASASLTLEFDPGSRQPGRLVRRSAASVENRVELAPWDPYEAIFSVLEARARGKPIRTSRIPTCTTALGPWSSPKRRAEACAAAEPSTSIMRPISEEANFKSVMTSTGCMILLGALVILPLALAGPSLGLSWTLFIPYVILPVLVIFAVLQLLRLAVRKPKSPEARPAKGAGKEVRDL